MKALIFNSGLGSRLGELTQSNPKCLVRLGSGETIFHRQLRILTACGIRQFVVTTGPWPEQVEAVAAEFEKRGCRFTFVRNDRFDQTNYLYSMWLARAELRCDDILLLHGDLVFDPAYVEELLALPAGSYGSIDPALPLPEKDFKARVTDGEVREVGVQTWGTDCTAFQALYRLTPEAMGIWLSEVESFVAAGETGVYAENAANKVFDRMHVKAHPYTGHVLEEIDTPEDLARVSAMVRASDFESQPAYVVSDGVSELVHGSAAGRVAKAPCLGDILAACSLHNPLVVADPFLTKSALEDILGTGVGPVFSGYEPNPTYEQVCAAVNLFRAHRCDAVVSVGGGSAIDVAKCVKLWASLPGDGTGRDEHNPRFCDADAGFSAIPHIAIPTTAGTGSESTHFAVVYVDGQKYSVAKDCLQPDVAILIPALLTGLPAYQRKATMLDALCQAIESYWSVASTEQSRAYSSRAIRMIMGSWEAYLLGDTRAARTMHVAANLAGRAINLTTTTLAHAMSYKITSLYGLAHGHAVALCMPYAWRTLLERGTGTTKELLAQIDALVTGDEHALWGTGLAAFEAMCQKLDLVGAKDVCETDIPVLVDSINVQRMSNYPLALSRDDLANAYRRILGL